MNRPVLSSPSAGVVSGPAWSAGADHKPKHGGIVPGTKSGDFEPVAKPEQIHIDAGVHGKAMKPRRQRQGRRFRWVGVEGVAPGAPRWEAAGRGVRQWHAGGFCPFHREARAQMASACAAQPGQA